MVEDEKLILPTLQGRGDLVKKSLTLLPIEELKLLILLGTQLV